MNRIAGFTAKHQIKAQVVFEVEDEQDFENPKAAFLKTNIPNGLLDLVPPMYELTDVTLLNPTACVFNGVLICLFEVTWTQLETL